MAASVRIEDEAFSDTRIELLGAILGTSKYDALGRLSHVWKQATQMGKDTLPIDLVALHVSVEALISAGLGVRQNGNRVRIKGARGRVEWLQKKREAGRLNGHMGKEFGRLGGRPKKTPTKPGEGVTENPPPAPAPAPAPALQPSVDSSCSEPPPTASEPTPAEPPVMSFPTVGTGGSEWNLGQGKVDEYRESFPGIDVMKELRKARQWCLDNAAKRKTPGGMTKFLGSWLSRAQDESGTRTRPAAAPPPTAGRTKDVGQAAEAMQTFLGNQTP